MIKQILYISIMWATLIFIGYNIVTAPQSAYSTAGFLDKDYDWKEFYDDNIDREDVERECDASEDYEANEKACKKAYDKIEEQEEDSKEAQKNGIDNMANEQNIVEDWRNEVQPEHKIGSPVTIPLDEEEEADEKVDEYNKQMDEYHHGENDEAEESSDESDESEDEEEEEPEEDSESESEE